MDFILNNYLIIILVGLFFVFALIGYLIDMLRKNHEIEKEDLPNIKPVEMMTINDLIEKEGEKPEQKESKENIDDADELLKNYEKDIIE